MLVGFISDASGGVSCIGDPFIPSKKYVFISPLPTFTKKKNEGGCYKLEGNFSAFADLPLILTMPRVIVFHSERVVKLFRKA